MTGNIGIDNIKVPEGSCNDDNCPFHGSLKVRGQVLEGTVVSDKMHQTAVVEKRYYHRLKKFKRYEKRTSRILAHNPGCIDAGINDSVKIMECRPISKTKSFVIISKE